MKTDKKVWILVVSLVVVIGGVAAALLLMPKQRETQLPDAAVPEEELIAAVQESWSAAVAADQPAYLTMLGEMASYTLGSVSKEEGLYVIEATVTAPDLGGRLSEMDNADLPRSADAEDLDTFLCEQIGKADMREITAAVLAYETDGGYHISFSEEFVDAMSGYLYTYSRWALLDMLQTDGGGE